jgi:hypothetical protein
MKNPFSQDLTEEFDGDFDGDLDDSSQQNLLAFMKQNKPIAPLPDPDFEQSLFAEIQKYPQRSPKQILNRQLKSWLPIVFIVPTAIVALIGFSWLNGRNNYQVAGNQLSDLEKSAIEQSLISSWNVTDTYPSNISGIADANINANVNANTRDIEILQNLSPLEYE